MEKIHVKRLRWKYLRLSAFIAGGQKKKAAS